MNKTIDVFGHDEFGVKAHVEFNEIGPAAAFAHYLQQGIGITYVHVMDWNNGESTHFRRKNIGTNNWTIEMEVNK